MNVIGSILEIVGSIFEIKFYPWCIENHANTDTLNAFASFVEYKWKSFYGKLKCLIGISLAVDGRIEKRLQLLNEYLIIYRIWLNGFLTHTHTHTKVQPKKCGLDRQQKRHLAI